MKHLTTTLCVAFILLAIVACDKAPDGVIPESKMEDLVVDLSLADAYIESHYDQFQDDSSRLVLKQSIFLKYGVTPELYDTSLVWYARNMDVYTKVYDNAIGRLQQMRDEVAKAPADGSAQVQQGPAHRSYAARGDSADVWNGPRRWMLTPGMRQGYITFDFNPDDESRHGDRYEVMFKANPMRSTFSLMLAADYRDGSTVYVQRPMCNEGWNNLILQTDSTRTIDRIYGFVRYDVMAGDIAYIDSLSLLRTHADPSTYRAVWGHRNIDRVKHEEPAAEADGAQPSATGSKETAVPVVPQGHFKPKEGVNKSSASRHVTQSPNATHLPQLMRNKRQ